MQRCLRTRGSAHACGAASLLATISPPYPIQGDPIRARRRRPRAAVAAVAPRAAVAPKAAFAAVVAAPPSVGGAGRTHLVCDDGLEAGGELADGLEDERLAAEVRQVARVLLVGPRLGRGAGRVGGRQRERPREGRQGGAPPEPNVRARRRGRGGLGGSRPAGRVGRDPGRGGPLASARKGPSRHAATTASPRRATARCPGGHTKPATGSRKHPHSCTPRTVRVRATGSRRL